MTLKDHLDLIRAHAEDAIKISSEEKAKKGRVKKFAEIDSNLWGILDRVVSIENTVMGTEFYDGESREIGT